MAPSCLTECTMQRIAKGLEANKVFLMLSIFTKLIELASLNDLKNVSWQLTLGKSKARRGFQHD